MIPLEIRVREEMAARLIAAGQPIPNPVAGIGLIDTGAAHSSVDVGVMKTMGIEAIGTTTFGGAKGIASHDTYPAALALQGEIVYEFPDLGGVYLAEVNRPGAIPLIAIIGRDILADCLLVYVGATGSYSLAIDTQSAIGQSIQGPGDHGGPSQ